MSKKEVIQLTEENAKIAKELLEAYQQQTYNIGEIELQIQRLVDQKNQLIQKYIELNKKEANLQEQLVKKYGAGKINPMDWTFVKE